MNFTKNTLIIIFSSFVLFSFNVQAKECNYFYYGFEEKIEFSNIPNKIIVGADVNIFPKTSDFEKLVHNLLSDYNIKSQAFAGGGFQIDFENEIDEFVVEKVKSMLLSMNGIVSVRNMHRLCFEGNDENGLEFGFINRISFQFLDDVLPSEIDEILNRFNVRKIVTVAGHKLHIVEKNVDVLEVANRLFETGILKYAYPSIICETKTTAYYPTDPYFKYQVVLHNVGQVLNDVDGHTGTYDADIDAPEAWAITLGNSNIVIAVIDNGITSNHPDLPNSRQVILPGSNFAYSNIINNPNDPSPVNNGNHGNGCAGIIAASHNNEGIAGIAPNCKIMPIRWDGRDAAGNWSTLTSQEQWEYAIKFAADNGANIISNSYAIGGPSPNSPNYNSDVVNAIQYAINKGVVVIFAAGNEARHSLGNAGYVCFPANANVSGMITVGASDRYDKQADYSPTSNPNSPLNQIVDIVAPSSRARDGTMPNEISEMWSLDIPGVDGENPRKRIIPPNLLGEVLPAANSGPNHLAYTGRFGGTSFAAPVVAGVAALVLSINPQLTPHQVKNILTETADKVGGYTYINGRSNEMGYGRVNAHKAVRRARCMRSDTPNSDNVTGIITGTRISRARNINVQNATVTSGATLELEVCNGSITINAGFKIEPSGRFIIW